MNRKVMGDKIALLRKERQLTQKQLADKISVTDKAVSKWERGLNYPDIEIIGNSVNLIAKIRKL